MNNDRPTENAASTQFAIGIIHGCSQICRAMVPEMMSIMDINCISIVLTKRIGTVATNKLRMH